MKLVEIRRYEQAVSNGYWFQWHIDQCHNLSRAENVMRKMEALAAATQADLERRFPPAPRRLPNPPSALQP